jgi:hypothetical protein
MSSLVIICLSSHYRFVLLPHYELVPSWPPLNMSKPFQAMLHELLLN